MSTTFERLQLAQSDDGPAPWPAETCRMALKAAYAEIDRLKELHDIGIKAIGQLGTDVEFWKQQQIDACIEANGLAVQCEQQEAEIDRLRANALEWVTVDSDDFATYPDSGAVVLVAPVGLYMIVARRVEYIGVWTPIDGGSLVRICTGDRWAYIPEAK